MVGTESVSVLERPVEIKGGNPIGTREGWASVYGDRNYSGGGYTVGWRAYASGAAVVELQAAVTGANQRPQLTTVDFVTHDEARAEFERIKGELFTREWVKWAADDLIPSGVLPEEFREQVLAGELTALLVAADWQTEHDNPDAGLLLRAAYHRIRGEGNVEVKVRRGVVVVLNPWHGSKRAPVVPRAAGECHVVVVEDGKGVRILRLYPKWPAGATAQVLTVEEKNYRVGDQAQYDAYNLSYYGPIKSVTAKTVVVVTDRYKEGAVARMPLAKFVAWNYGFDLAKAQERNANWSD